MGLFILIATSVLGGLLAWFLLSILQQKLLSPHLPLRLPLIGHFYLFDDVHNLHLVFSKLADKYGDVLKLQVMSQAWTIISSPEAAKKTTSDQRSVTYSTRPPPKFIRDFWLFEGHENILSMPSGETWRKYRKLIHPLLSSTAVKEYDALLIAGTQKLVEALKQRADGVAFDPDALARSFPFNVTINILFGISREPTDPNYTELIEVIKGINSATMIGKVSDLLPAIRYLPLPAWERMRYWVRRRDVWFVREMNDARTRIQATVGSEYDAASVERARNSFLGKLLLQMERDPEARLHDASIINILVDLVFAGVDTSATVIIYFFSFMANHPKVLKKLQEEIDEKFPKGRLPSSSDEVNLPYVNAVINELLRLRPPAPLALPHSVVEDDVLDGVHIQKESYIWYNIWRIHRHPRYWSEPVEGFDPDRFLRFEKLAAAAASDDDDDDVVSTLKDNPANLVHFGFGRRNCPGQYLARRELFLAISTIASEFDIEKPEGVDWVNDTGSLGTTLKPVPFQVVLKRRLRASV